MAALHKVARADGWLIDHGDVYDASAKHGWRCTQRITWWPLQPAAGYRNAPFALGDVQNPERYYDRVRRVSHAQCPDGSPNTFDVAVANGIYMVTAGFDFSNGQPTFHGCMLENVRPMRWGSHQTKSRQNTVGKGEMQWTLTMAIEVRDGTFTLSAEHNNCPSVNWVKLDLLSEANYPPVWLPAPKQAWWQMKLDAPAAGVGLVKIQLPHQPGHSMLSHPRPSEGEAPDCRRWWLFRGNSCPRLVKLGKYRGAHPDLAQYPNHPGYPSGFLSWLWDDVDVSPKDGVLTWPEWLTGMKALDTKGWVIKGDDRKYTDLFQRIVQHAAQAKTLSLPDGATAPSYSTHDATIAKDDWMAGFFAQPQGDWCDPLNKHLGGNCERVPNSAYMVPDEWGTFADDGNSGVVVALSDTPCTDGSACDTSGETVCAFLRTTGNNQAEEYDTGSPLLIDCAGATGKYLRLRLPGADGTRLLAVESVNVHKANIADAAAPAPAQTEPRKPMVCYGVQMKDAPAADDPNILADTKQHAFKVVVDNPEDPVFFSTCYTRSIIKKWYPLEGVGNATGNADGALWSFDDGKHCLSCASYRQNYAREAAEGYSMATMPTPQWWLKKDGCACTDCEDQSKAALFDDDMCLAERCVADCLRRRKWRRPI